MWDHNYSKRSEWSKTKPINIYSYCSIKVIYACVTCHYCLCFCLSFRDGLKRQK